MTMATDLQERLQRLARDLEDCDLFLDGLLPSGLDSPRSTGSSPDVADAGKAPVTTTAPAAPSRSHARKQRAPVGPSAAPPPGVPAPAPAARGPRSARQQPPREGATEAQAGAPAKRGSRHKANTSKEAAVAGVTHADNASEGAAVEVVVDVSVADANPDGGAPVAEAISAKEVVNPDGGAPVAEAASAKEVAVEEPQASEGARAASTSPENLSSEKRSCQAAQAGAARCPDGRARAQRHRRQRPQQIQKPPWGQPPKSVDLTRCPCEWCGEVDAAPGHAGRCKLRQVECQFCGQKLARVMREAHERSCLERPNADACADNGESGTGVGSEVGGGPYRLGSCSSRGPSRVSSRAPSRAPSRGPSRGPSRSATPRCGSVSPKSRQEGKVRSGTPLLSAENDALCAQSRARLQAEVGSCRSKLDAAIQQALAHPQEAEAERETIRELETKLGAMSQQLSVLEWASLQAPPPDAQAQEAGQPMELQGRDALDTFVELQRRLDTLEVSLEVLASNQPSSPCSSRDAGLQTRTPRSASARGAGRHTAQTSWPSAPPPPSATAPLPATPGGSPRQRVAALAAGDRPRQAPAPKRLPGVLPPLGTGHSSQPCASAVSSAPPSRGRCTSADGPPAAQRGNSERGSRCGSRSAASKPRSSTARRRCSSERRPATGAGAEATGGPASAASLEEVDLRSAIEAERRQYIQRRLLETQDAALPRPPAHSAAMDAGHDSQKARDLKNDSNVLQGSGSGTTEVPSVEELRLQMQREREAYISRLMPIGGSGDSST
mmetsp:Transcript_72936/g.120801  ORF Transcript_72936/g.120801 Transcript_72936/m.120801 type:complete len:781 (-) Transcript_72936:27-2369(-)